MAAAFFSDTEMFYKLILIFISSAITTSCVTETTESPSMKFDNAAVIAVQDPMTKVIKGSTIAWLPEAVRFYDDERLKDAPIKAMIENEIVKNIKAKELNMVDSVAQSKFAIAYTAALESSLDDVAIVRNFGLSPGNSQIPQDDANVEKGSLIIYVFDNANNDVVWRSAAQAGVQFDMSADQRKERVERVIAEMFQTLQVKEK